MQFLGAALAALPFAAAEGLPAAHPGAVVVLAAIGLTIGGTLVPFSLFAFGQKKVSAEMAGAFLNLEPVVGAIVGIVAFGDPAGPRQFGGGAGILVGIALSSLPLLAARQRATQVAAGPRQPDRRAEPALLAEPAVPEPTVPDESALLEGALLAEGVLLGAGAVVDEPAPLGEVVLFPGPPRGAGPPAKPPDSSLASPVASGRLGRRAGPRRRHAARQAAAGYP